MSNLEKLFHPNSVAIVGASEEEGKIGNIVSKNLLELGYQGKIFFVNQKHSELFGQACYKNLADIPEDVDLAVIAVPAKFVNEIVEGGAGKIKNYVIISAGFSEIGGEGKKREEELKAIADKNDLNILGPNCLGFIVPKMKLNASFGAGMVEAGNISFVSQSGALISALLDIAKKEKLGFSQIVSIGNKTDVDESEMLEFLARDEETKVVGMYLEGIKNGTQFIEALKNISRIKPVVILKAGKTEKAQKAISSHTGALAGSDEIIDAVFEKCGVIRAQNSEDFFGLLKLISRLKNNPGEKVAVVTNAGGAGVLATDAFKNKEVQLGEISSELKGELEAFLPAESSVENPVDLLGDALEDRYQKALAVLEKQNGLETIVAILTPQNQTPCAKIAKILVAFKNSSQKNLVAIFIGGEKIEEALQILNENAVANFFDPESAVRALNQYYLWKKKSETRNILEEIIVNEVRKNKVLEIINKARGEERGVLYFNEASQIFDFYGIQCSQFLEAVPSEELHGDLNFPLVVKIDSPKILHKSDQEALILNLKDEQELEESISKLAHNFPGEKIVIQEMAEKGMELILGIKKDSTFGPAIVFGLGGIYTEVFQMVDLLILPSSLEEILERLKRSRIQFLFSGERGQKPYNLEELAGILFKLQNLALEIPEIQELDVNPLFVYNNGKSALAVDVKIII